MRFRAEQRLRRQLDFRAARERGRRIECGGFTLWYVRRPVGAISSSPAASELGYTDVSTSSSAPAGGKFSRAPEGARVGVVASTAAVGNAVRRNRAKRRLRDIFRRHQALVPADVDLLLIARNSLNRLDYAELERKFVETCRRLFASKP